MSRMPSDFPAGIVEGEGWRPAAIQPAFAQPLRRKSTRYIPMLRVAATLTRVAAGHYLVDMGREVQGGQPRGSRIETGARTAW